MKRFLSLFSLGVLIIFGMLIVVFVAFVVFKAIAPCEDGDNNCLYGQLIEQNEKRNFDSEHISSYFAPMYELCDRMATSPKKTSVFCS